MMMAEDNKKEETKTAKPEAEPPKDAPDKAAKPGAKAKDAKGKPAEAEGKAPKKKKIKAPSEQGHVYIQATFNNTIMSFTDASGNVLTTGSPGMAGFKGTRKSTPYASTVAAQQAAERAKQAGLKTVAVFVRGVGSGRDSAIRALQNSGLQISSLKDVTPAAHNGVRAKKPRRV
jgi:small subunit ribosomal protein S11